MIEKPVVRVVDCLRSIPSLTFHPGEVRPFRGPLSDYINNVFGLVNVTLVSSRTQPKRVTCKRLGRLRKDGSGYTGMLGLLERNEADTLLVPFPWALDGQIVNFGPTGFREDSALLHMYNRTYRTPDVTEDFVSMKFNVLGSIFASFILIAVVNYITGLVHSKKRALLDCFWTSFRSFLGPNAFDFKKDNRLFRLSVIIAAMMFIIVFSNLIASNSVTQMETVKFDNLEQLLQSNDFRPIWVVNLITANMFVGENSIITRVSRRTFENSSSFRTYQLESRQTFQSMAYSISAVREKQRVLVGITALIDFTKKSILQSNIRDYEHVHIPSDRFDFALFAYGYSKKMDSSARTSMDKRQYALFESGVNSHMYQEFISLICSHFFYSKEAKLSDLLGEEGIRQELRSIKIKHIKRILTFYAVSVIFTGMLLCFEFGYNALKLRQLNNKMTRSGFSRKFRNLNRIVIVKSIPNKPTIKPRYRLDTIIEIV